MSNRKNDRLMKIYEFPARNLWLELCQRPKDDDASLRQTVSEILLKVKSEGDQALRELTAKYDSTVLQDLQVDISSLVMSDINQNLKKAIGIATQNITKFHKTQIQEPNKIETYPGVFCWRKSIAISNVGLYIPGGSAPLFSTVLMLGIPANLAGCSRITLCTPPRPDGSIDPAILHAAQLSGVHELYAVGGAQAIAAMAYGTESIKPVNKIFGPGNQYVTLAKQMLQAQGIAIDMPAGPSELLVIGDEHTEASFVAADLLSQAEHGPDSQVLFLTNSISKAIEVKHSIKIQMETLPRKDIARKSLQHCRLIVLEDMETILRFSNLYAPEHLIINCANAVELSEKVINAGSVFIGPWSSESAGDYASGTNHTLPTAGYAKCYSGVSVDSFVKKITYQNITAKGLKNLGPHIEAMAEAEKLEAHKRAISIRLKKLDNV